MGLSVDYTVLHRTVYACTFACVQYPSAQAHLQSIPSIVLICTNWTRSSVIIEHVWKRKESEVRNPMCALRMCGMIFAQLGRWQPWFPHISSRCLCSSDLWDRRRLLPFQDHVTTVSSHFFYCSKAFGAFDLTFRSERPN